jgi:hypothetical protein
VSLEDVIVAVISKFPDAGRVKTRLTSLLSPEDACRVHRVFLTHVVGRLKALGPVALKVVCDPPEKLEAMRAMLNIPDELLPQRDGDLGARLAHAADQIRAASSRPVLIFGIDSPDLPQSHIRSAAHLLSDFEVVLGACEDGGYWCLGISPKVDAPRLLSDIAWSSGREREQTAACARSLGYRVAEAAMWDDVDRPADLKRLLARLAASKDAEHRNLLDRLAFLPKDVLS